MKITIVLLAGLISLLWDAAAGDASPLSGGWKHQDIGAVEVTGSATVQAELFTIRGTLDTWGTNDGFHFVYQPLHGDGSISARVLTVENTANHAKAGVMIRETLTPGARHAQACVTPVDGTQFLFRAETNEKTASMKGRAEKGKLPCWVRLKRAGNTFTAYESATGGEWTAIGSTNIVMGAHVYVGLVSSSHQKTNLCTATIDSVKLSDK